MGKSHRSTKRTKIRAQQNKQLGADKPSVISAIQSNKSAPKPLDKKSWSDSTIFNKFAYLIITLIGLIAYFPGLNSPFQGDDSSQIVDNPVVHSLSHIVVLFEGSTFYIGKGIAPLSGTFYKPLMTTLYAIIYSFFGPHPFYFHITQLLLCIASAIILYKVFRYSFKPVLSLLLATIFLVHPLDSQVVYAIPSMQDAMFFFFGILSFYLLLRFKSIRSLIPAVIFLFLSMLSKETALGFILISLLYLYWWDRKRFWPFVWFMVFPVIIYLSLRFNAVGFENSIKNAAPIGRLGLFGRIMTMPSIILFYISKLVFPWRLASIYQWAHPTFSFRYFLVPLIIELVILSLIIGTADDIRNKGNKGNFYTYTFFAIWVAIGIILHLQIIPLDMTVCEIWFYFTMAGVLGMTGVVLTSYEVNQKWIIIIGVILISLFGARTFSRGFDWNNPVNLSHKDIAASPQDYDAYNVLSAYYLNKQNFSLAARYANESIKIFPSYNNYNDLGASETGLGNYAQAVNAYDSSLQYSNTYAVYENLGLIAVLVGSESNDLHLLQLELKTYPNDYKLWMYLAIVYQKNGDNKDAITAINTAKNYGPVLPYVLEGITGNKIFTFYVTGINKSITV